MTVALHPTPDLVELTSAVNHSSSRLGYVSRRQFVGSPGSSRGRRVLVRGAPQLSRLCLVRGWWRAAATASQLGVAAAGLLRLCRRADASHPLRNPCAPTHSGNPVRPTHSGDLVGLRSAVNRCSSGFGCVWGRRLVAVLDVREDEELWFSADHNSPSPCLGATAQPAGDRDSARFGSTPCCPQGVARAGVVHRGGTGWWPDSAGCRNDSWT
jgi:hypothetical protein